jgi:hypothetical protein
MRSSALTMGKVVGDSASGGRRGSEAVLTRGGASLAGGEEES